MTNQFAHRRISEKRRAAFDIVLTHVAAPRQGLVPGSVGMFAPELVLGVAKAVTYDCTSLKQEAWTLFLSERMINIKTRILLDYIG
jgi:ribosomal protein S16